MTQGDNLMDCQKNSHKVWSKEKKINQKLFVVVSAEKNQCMKYDGTGSAFSN